jgi:hypothetical protein
MILCFPLPGYIGQVIQRMQVEWLKLTDARVTCVTEAMNVLRMVRLYSPLPTLTPVCGPH